MPWWISIASILIADSLAAASPAESPLPAGGQIDFRRDVEPILAGACLDCHGPKRQRGGLRLDSAAAVRDGGNGGPPIVAGKAGESLIIRRVLGLGGEDRMPLNRPPLDDEKIRILRAWIDGGAAWADEAGAAPVAAATHWSHRKPEYRPPPAVKTGGWARSGIDAFILDRLEREGLATSPEADRRTLIRRLSLDLTGLPPESAEVESFASDGSADGYDRLVDRLLGSPHFGERMAVWWLDLVRYGDSIGYHSDNPQAVDAYRDWVIGAFNSNMPFHVFTTEQLAGDLLPGATAEGKIASGYNRLNLTTEEGGAQEKEYRAKYAADRVRNYSSVWMAATVGCAECHNHKFDPYGQKDFYGLAAFFADIRDATPGQGRPADKIDDCLLLPAEAQAAELKRIDASLAARKARIEGQPPPPAEELEALNKAQTDEEKRRVEFIRTIRRTLIAVSDPPRTTRVLPRGNWMDDSGEVVEPSLPRFLPPLGVEGRRPTRLDLARWTVSRENPFTPRVVANRLWKLFFGTGLAKHLDDLGVQGEPPSHPELLDWLAIELVNSGWDVKHLVRLLVSSSAYRQDSRGRPDLREKDPYNRLVARQSRFRLDAEFVRDAALAASGLLVRTVGGPSVKPYQPAGYWDYLNFPTRTWVHDTGPSQYRRGLYTWWQRTFLHPSFLAFDAPTREECTAERPRSNTPLQALVLLDDPTYVEAARAFAARILKEGGADPEARVAWAWRTALGRPPAPEESGVLLELVEKHRERYRGDREAAEKLIRVGDSPPPADLDAGELAAWTSAARTILNTGEAITRP